MPQQSFDPPDPFELATLPERVARRVRALHMSARTEEAYAHWTRKLMAWAGQRHPAQLGPEAVKGFLAQLATSQALSPSSQRQALSALLFLYREVLGMESAWLAQLKRPFSASQAPALSPAEAQRLLAAMGREGNEDCARAARLVYGTGLRLAQVLRLRVKDIDFETHRIALREVGEGRPRQVALPQWLVAELQAQLATARERWQVDRQCETPAGLQPDLASPRAAALWAGYWLFPAQAYARESRSGTTHRPHLHERRVQRELGVAAQRCGLGPSVGVQSLRHAFGQHLLQAPTEEAATAPPAVAPPPARKPSAKVSAYRRRSVHDDPSFNGEEPIAAYAWSVREPSAAWRVTRAPAALRPRWHRRAVGLPVPAPFPWSRRAAGAAHRLSPPP